jgi:hypothetical protein
MRLGLFFEYGFLNYEDYKENEINDGSLDFCEVDLLTSEKVIWNILPSDTLRITLKKNEDGSDIIIEPYGVKILDEDTLEIRYKEFENSGDEYISYFIYEYFNIFI